MKQVLSVFMILIYLCIPVGIGYLMYSSKLKKPVPHENHAIKVEKPLTICLSKASDNYISNQQAFCHQKKQDDNCTLDADSLGKANAVYLKEKEICFTKYPRDGENSL